MAVRVTSEDLPALSVELILLIESQSQKVFICTTRSNHRHHSSFGRVSRKNPQPSPKNKTEHLQFVCVCSFYVDDALCSHEETAEVGSADKEALIWKRTLNSQPNAGIGFKCFGAIFLPLELGKQNMRLILLSD